MQWHFPKGWGKNWKRDDQMSTAQRSLSIFAAYRTLIENIFSHMYCLDVNIDLYRYVVFPQILTLQPRSSRKNVCEQC